jgi:iron(III) transport system substrate-binding protein
MKISVVILLTIVYTGQLSAAEEPRREWTKVVEAAKREGRLTIHITRAQTPILNAGVFQKAYPEIKILEIVGEGNQVYQRLLAERRAGKYLGDVLIAGITDNYQVYRAKGTASIKAAMILPEVADDSKWWQGRHHFADPEREHLLMYIGVPLIPRLSYNKSMVNPKEFRSIRDLFNPKWQGKMIALDVRGGGPAGGSMRVMYYHPALGPDFIRQLYGTMDITLTRDRRQAVDWLGAGKLPLCLFCSDSDIERAKAQGLPVDVLELDQAVVGLSAQGGTVALLNRAPHPNAATVFVNWLLSRDGQATLQKSILKSGGFAPDSLRIDIPKDEVLPGNRRKEGVKYIDLNDVSRLDMRPIIKVMEEGLAEAKRAGGAR